MKVKGFDSLIRKLKKLPNQAQSEVKNEIRDAADMIVMDAGDAAPVDLGYLKNSIRNFPRQGGFNYEVNVGARYSPFVEFGTGTEVDVPEEIKDYAYQFKGGNKRQINIPARPFFFPAYFKHRDELIENLKDMLKRHLR
ncbi:MAG: HK97 gp10 family phage protein [Chryseobacterium sp.]|nr:MAG: HK97 gp10 family phage protein [Chryseobacterium sp.]